MVRLIECMPEWLPQSYMYFQACSDNSFLTLTAAVRREELKQNIDKFTSKVTGNKAN